MAFEQAVNLYGEFASNVLMVSAVQARSRAVVNGYAADQVAVLTVRECDDTAGAASSDDPMLD